MSKNVQETPHNSGSQRQKVHVSEFQEIDPEVGSTKVHNLLQFWSLLGGQQLSSPCLCSSAGRHDVAEWSDNSHAQSVSLAWTRMRTSSKVERQCQTAWRIASMGLNPIRCCPCVWSARYPPPHVHEVIEIFLSRGISHSGVSQCVWVQDPEADAERGTAVFNKKQAFIWADGRSKHETKAKKKVQ